MRQSIQLVINGQNLLVDGEAAFETLSTFLRETLGLVGTKIVCSEGDCGACSVLVGRPSTDRSKLNYKPIDSCIAFLYQLDQTHIVTVEGLGVEQQLSPVQEAMVKCHGSQCGFCTPGFITTMHGLYEESRPPCGSNGDAYQIDEEILRIGLSGNLCRCTGYVQIIRAAQSISVTEIQKLNEMFPPDRIIDFFDSVDGECVSVEDDDRQVYLPKNLKSAIAFYAEHPEARLVAGATDLGVQHNHGRPKASTIICLSDVEELSGVSIEQDRVVIGAGATWADILDSTRIVFSELADVLLRFGSPQIRNFGTIGGNLANASPIADSIPFLYVVGAELELFSLSGIRKVAIEDFYQGYKQVDLKSGELIHAVQCPRVKPNQSLKLYKISKRRDMDISTFTAAILLTLGANDTIAEAKVALGGVGPTVIRARKTEQFLVGRELNEVTMRESGIIARTEITPISDVRGSTEYRFQLAENVMLKFFHDIHQQRVTS